MDKIGDLKLTNPFDEKLLHEHVCGNCGTHYTCAMPDCTGGSFDRNLCPDCEEDIGEFW